jgi:4a-hydroxytetrahydrobiopterin dehydratase
MRPTKLTTEEVAENSRSLPDWQVIDNQIERQFQFPGFAEAMAFVNRVAEAAESMDHHPDIDIRYNRVKLVLSTHDAGGLTTNDFDLAAKADALTK